MKTIILIICSLFIGSVSGYHLGNRNTAKKYQEVIHNILPMKGYSVCCNAITFLFPSNLAKSKKKKKLFKQVVVCSKCHLQCKKLGY